MVRHKKFKLLKENGKKHQKLQLGKKQGVYESSKPNRNWSQNDENEEYLINVEFKNVLKAD